MADIKHIIEPERMGLWVAVTFIIALLALGVASVGLKRINNLMYVTQVEMLMLNKKIEAIKPTAEAPAQPAAQEQK